MFDPNCPKCGAHDYGLFRTSMVGCPHCLRADNERLRGLLADAAEDIEHWGGYASPYFQDKWNLQADIDKYRAAAGTTDRENVTP